MRSLRKENLKTTDRFRRWLDIKRGRPVEWDLSLYLGILKDAQRISADLKFESADDAFLKSRAAGLMEHVRRTGDENAALAEACALVREASSRTLGIAHYDVQLIAGAALHLQKFIEMGTGEGKTLVAVIPAFLGALAGRGVHVLTFNDYLARRDARWMAPVYEYLGLRVAFVVQGMTATERRAAYGADVTYLTAREAGYDFLKSSLARDVKDLVMRPFNLAIVDEADSILVDEARVPLVIAGKGDIDIDEERIEIAELVAKMRAGVDFDTDENSRNAFLSEKGMIFTAQQLGCRDILDEDNRDGLTRINQALHARVLLTRDVDYILENGQVKIVDEFTGRVVKDRHWPDGLHRAVEAKEHVAICEQGRVQNSITMQHLLNLYPKMCGMTGTIIPADEELHHFYGRRTLVVPHHLPCTREDLPDVLFTHKEAKLDAIVEEVKRAFEKERPVLIGTADIEESEVLAARLEEVGIPCNVLNAKNDEEEAKIVEMAGALRAVTVSTNMAGRGTDIKLGGKDEEDREQVVALGGLYVIGTARFESRRVDDQLRGRAGRQGDPGLSRYFLSLDDDLLRRFGVEELIPKKHLREKRCTPIEDRVISDKIAVTQRIVEGQNYDIRRTLWNYTSNLERQRLKWYERRTDVLQGRDLGRLALLCPEKFGDLERCVSKEVLTEVEKQITLFHMDRSWVKHLENIADIREGIHLHRLGGLDPVLHFYRLAADLYDQMEEDLEEKIGRTFEAVHVTPEGIDLEKEGLKGPTSTWTYLVNDNPFSWLGGLSEMSNVGLGIAAGLYFGPFFVLRSLYRKLFKKNPHSD